MERYRRLFALPGAKTIAFCSLTGRSAFGVIGISLLVWLGERRGIALAGAVAGATAAGSALASPRLGRLIDRLGPRLLLPLLGLGSITAFVGLVVAEHFGMPGAALVAIGALAGACEPPNLVLARTWWWNNCPTGQLRLTAMSFEGVVSPLAFGGAMLLAVASFASVGVGATLAWAVALSSITPMVFAVGRVGADWPRGAHEQRTPDPGSLLRVRALRLLVGPQISVLYVAAATGPIATAIAIDTGRPELAPVPVVAYHLGALIGAYGLTRSSERLRPELRLMISMIASAALLAACAPLPGLWWLTLGLLIVGLARGGASPMLAYLTASSVPAERLAEANGLLSSAIFIGLMLGNAVSGLVVASWGVSGALLVAAALVAATTLGSWGLLHHQTPTSEQAA